MACDMLHVHQNIHTGENGKISEPKFVLAELINYEILKVVGRNWSRPLWRDVARRKIVVFYETQLNTIDIKVFGNDVIYIFFKAR